MDPSTIKKRLEAIIREVHAEAPPIGIGREHDERLLSAQRSLALIEAGEIRIGDLSEEALGEICDAVGMDAVLDAIENVEAEADAPVVARSTARADSADGPFRLPFGRLGQLGLAAAIAAACLIGIGFLAAGPGAGTSSGPTLATDDTPANARPALNLEVAWEQLPTLPAFGTWRAIPADLSDAMPSLTEDVVVTAGSGTADRWRALKLSTVIVRSDSGFGSGVIVHPDGWIVSNYHVVESSVQEAALRGETAQLGILLPALVNERVRAMPEAAVADVMRVDATADLALLKLREAPADLVVANLADQLPEEADEVVVVGSPAGQSAWQVRRADVSSIFDFPSDLSENIAKVATEPTFVGRERPRVIQTTAEISYGDSGGPVFNANHELVGITFATPSNLSSGSVGFHIALGHVQQILGDLPDSPEVIPPDLWNAASTGLQRQGPRVQTSSNGRQIASLEFIFRGVTQSPFEDQPRMGPEPVAMLRFVDEQERASRPESEQDGSALLPSGLWSMEELGAQPWSYAVLQRRGGPVLAAYTNEEGNTREIRIGPSPSGPADLIYRRNASGQWEVSRPVGTAVLDRATQEPAGAPSGPRTGPNVIR